MKFARLLKNLPAKEKIQDFRLLSPNLKYCSKTGTKSSAEIQNATKQGGTADAEIQNAKKQGGNAEAEIQNAKKQGGTAGTAEAEIQNAKKQGGNAEVEIQNGFAKNQRVSAQGLARDLARDMKFARLLKNLPGEEKIQDVYAFDRIEVKLDALLEVIKNPPQKPFTIKRVLFVFGYAFSIWLGWNLGDRGMENFWEFWFGKDKDVLETQEMIKNGVDKIMAELKAIKRVETPPPVVSLEFTVFLVAVMAFIPFCCALWKNN